MPAGWARRCRHRRGRGRGVRRGNSAGQYPVRAARRATDDIGAAPHRYVAVEGWGACRQAGHGVAGIGEAGVVRRGNSWPISCPRAVSEVCGHISSHRRNCTGGWFRCAIAQLRGRPQGSAGTMRTPYALTRPPLVITRLRFGCGSVSTPHASCALPRRTESSLQIVQTGQDVPRHSRCSIRIDAISTCLGATMHPAIAPAHALVALRAR